MDCFMKKHFNRLLIAGAVLLLLGITACSDDPSQERSIISFVINGKIGAIDTQNDLITVVLPAGTNLTTLSPEIVISRRATVSPASGTAVDLSNPATYTVTAENGSIRQYIITVTAAENPNLQLVGIEITELPEQLDYFDNDALNLNGIEVTGLYSDGSSVVLDPYYWTASGFTAGSKGTQTVRISHNDKNQFFDTFEVTVFATEKELKLDISLRGDGRDIVVFGIPQGQEEMIVLSWTGQPDEDGNLTIPTQIIIGTRTADYNTWTWRVNNTSVFSWENIITLNARDYTLERPHTITFTGQASNGLWYSKTIEFTVVN
jgi:hypothetical protein